MTTARQLGASLLVLLAAVLSACGRTGDASHSSCSLCGSLNDVSGSIADNSGHQAQLASWLIVAVEEDTGIARLAQIDANGLYTFSQVRTDHAQTLVLLSPDYILRAVLSIPVPGSETTISQWVDLQNAQIPPLVNNGTIISFSSLDGVNVHNSAGENASATAMNGLPDGSTKISGLTSLNAALTGKSSSQSLGLSSAAPDCHSLDPDSDPDINCDGLINLFDWDENGNHTIDVFDPDANSDLSSDVGVTGYNTAQWFKEGVSYIAPEFVVSPKADNKTMQNSMKFSVKVDSDTSPLAVKIRGSTATLANATYNAVSATCAITATPWPTTLLDDGQSEDGAANDGVYGEHIYLTGAGPRANEVMFFELEVGSASAPYAVDYAWIWPPVTTSTITATYAAPTNTVQLVGNPFANAQGTAIADFQWSVSVYEVSASGTATGTAGNCDSNTSFVWASELVSGAKRSTTIPASVLAKGMSYTFQVTAQSLNKVPGIPAYSLQSVQYPVK